jgi:hypothetical protein
VLYRIYDRELSCILNEHNTIENLAFADQDDQAMLSDATPVVPSAQTWPRSCLSS